MFQAQANTFMCLLTLPTLLPLLPFPACSARPPGWVCSVPCERYPDQSEPGGDPALAG